MSTDLVARSTSSPPADAERPPASQVRGATNDEAAVAEPVLLRVLAQVAARLQERNPTASGELIRRCIDDAVRMFSDAPVRLYLPILVERGAQSALRAAMGPPARGGEGDPQYAPETQLRAGPDEATS
jgi:hypothetical protein